MMVSQLLISPIFGFEAFPNCVVRCTHAAKATTKRKIKNHDVASG